MDFHHGKVLLRRLAAERFPDVIAWRPKSEPLSEWLIQRWLSQDANVARTLEAIKGSRLLVELVDPATVAASALHARQIRGRNWLGSSIVELGALVEWVTTLEARFGLCS